MTGSPVNVRDPLRIKKWLFGFILFLPPTNILKCASTFSFLRMKKMGIFHIFLFSRYPSYHYFFPEFFRHPNNQVRTALFMQTIAYFKQLSSKINQSYFLIKDQVKRHIHNTNFIKCNI